MKNRWMRVFLSVVAVLTLNAVMPDTASAETQMAAQNENDTLPVNSYIPDQYSKPYTVSENETDLLTITPQARAAKYETADLPAIRNQNPYGTCWAFSTISLCEINLMKKGYSETDLSELHLAYFTSHSVNDPLGGLEGDDITYTNTGISYLDYGGNYTMALNTLSDWRGAAAESLVPYSSAYSTVSDGLSSALAYQSVAQLRSYISVPMSEREQVKQAIVDYGAVGISYYATATYGSDSYFNADTAAYYCYDRKRTNHAVSVVGWDDNFPASKFPSKPSGNGAWIVRNSWGNDWGDEGYFYLSYYDQSISGSAVAVDMEITGTYGHNYQYDGTLYGYGTFSSNAANVFTTGANPDGAESLVAASFEIETDGGTVPYKVKVYTGLSDELNPQSGTLAASVSGSSAVDGQNMVVFPTAVELSEGERFSIVVEHTGGYIYIDSETSGDFSSVSAAKAGQSFVSGGDGCWTDWGASYRKNIHIKAYTNDVAKSGSPGSVAATGISLNRTSLELKQGASATLIATVTPSDVTDKTVKWSTSDGSVATVDAYGNVTAVGKGTAVISAWSKENARIKATCTVNVTIPVSKISVYSDWAADTDFYVGRTYQFYADVIPSYASNTGIIWKSDNTSVLTVDQNGLVSPVGAGTANVMAVSEDGNCTGKYSMTTRYQLNSTSISGETTVEQGCSTTLSLTWNPAQIAASEFHDIEWSVADPGIASIDTNGKLTGLRSGSTTVSVEAIYGNHVTIHCQINAVVRPKAEETEPGNSSDTQLNGWVTENGKDYWYENGVRQGYDPNNTDYRGKEIYDPSSGAWYWLDNVQQGAKAVSKDVYQESDAGQWADREDGTGKWVRYDENGHMVKGWQTTDAGTYYFDVTYGTMAKGSAVIDGSSYYFDPNTGILQNSVSVQNGWWSSDGKDYWYENGVRQGYDPDNVDYRGKEIYDPASDAWYWLDNIQQGAKAVNKDVYQESLAGDWGDRTNESGEKVGKWVRYDENGHMVKGWQTTDTGTYYFDPMYGTMAKGDAWIDGTHYYFDPVTGVRQ